MPTLPNPSGLGPGLTPVPRVDRDPGKWKQTMHGYPAHTHTAPRTSLHPSHTSQLQTPMLLLRHNYHLWEWLRGHFVQNTWKERTVIVPQDLCAGGHTLHAWGCRVKETEGRRNQIWGSFLHVSFWSGSGPGISLSSTKGTCLFWRRVTGGSKAKPVWKQALSFPPWAPHTNHITTHPLV